MNDTYVSKYLRNQGKAKAWQPCHTLCKHMSEYDKKVAQSKKQKAERNITFIFNKKCNMYAGLGM